MYPKLRLLYTHLVEHQGQQIVMLRDPLQLTNQAVFVPWSLAPLLKLCDGTRDENGLRAALEVQAGLRLDPAHMQSILTQMDEALLFDNERFAAVCAEVLQEYRAAPARSLSSAGQSYPDGPEELKAFLDGFSDLVRDKVVAPHGAGPVHGLVSPHIDFQRGGPIYALAWSALAEELPYAELVIIFGTDHIGGEGKITLTYQHYATPWGVLPTARDVVEEISQAIGLEEAFAEELHHRSEHSIELAAIWLHYTLLRKNAEARCQLVPILCGAFDPAASAEERARQEERFSAMLEALRRATAGRRTLAIAAGDLAHVGPAFGDFFPFDFSRRASLRAADERLIEAICAGDAEAFRAEVEREGNRWNVCGLPPIYLTLRFLGKAEGYVLGYAQCPADVVGASLVSICGIALR